MKFRSLTLPVLHVKLLHPGHVHFQIALVGEEVRVLALVALRATGGRLRTVLSWGGRALFRCLILRSFRI